MAKAGIVSAVADACGVHIRTVHKWRTNPKIAAMFEEVREARLDLAESTIIKAIKRDNITAAIFLLKCHGRHRGWVERPKEPEKLDTVLMSPEEMATRIREAIRAADATVPAPVEVCDGKGGSPLN
jgi:hypothetical protein